MKRLLVLLLAVIMIVSLSGCFGSLIEIGDPEDTDEPGKTQAPGKTEDAKKTYGIGEKISIKKNGKELYTLVINSVTTTDERNQFSEKDPAQVIIINYTYDNTGSEDDIFISLMNFKVIDSGGNVCDTYPVGSLEYPAQYTPQGAKCTATEAYGLVVAGGTIKLNFYENIFGSKADVVFEFNVDQ